MNAPRDDLFRMTAAPVSGDGNTLHGYAAVFNSPTEINGWEGHFTEVIAPGAFRRTLDHQGDRVKVLFNHGFDPTLGELPLGKPSRLEEDERGLFVEVPLADTDYNRDRIRPLIEAGALDGMSFRFSVTDDEWNDEGTHRTIRQVKLYELGPVTFPAYEATTLGIRSREAYLNWRRDPSTATSTGPAEWHPGPVDGPPQAPVDFRKRYRRIVVANLRLKGDL